MENEEVYSGCRIEIEDGFIVERCGEEITKICIPGTTTIEGGFTVLGTGGNGGGGHPDIRCLCASEIREKMEEAGK